MSRTLKCERTFLKFLINEGLFPEEQDKNWHEFLRNRVSAEKVEIKGVVCVNKSESLNFKQNVINNWKMMINESFLRQKPITSHGVRYRVYLEFKKSGHWSRSIDPCSNPEIKHSSLLAKILIAFFKRIAYLYDTSSYIFMRTSF